MPDQINGLLSPWLRERRIKPALPFIKGNVLDFGCGIGALYPRIKCESYTGMDVDNDSLETARKTYPENHFLHIDSLGELTQAFDTIVALAVIEHVPDPAATLLRLKELLASGGRIVMTTPNPGFDRFHELGGKFGLFSKEGHAEHQSLLGKRGIYEAAGKAGFKVEVYQRFLFGANQLAVLAVS